MTEEQAETPKKRKKVEHEYVVELLDGTTRTVTTTDLRKAKKHAWVMYHDEVKDVRRADGIVSNPWNPAWTDGTRKQRQQNRRTNLNTVAEAAGFASWDDLATAATKGVYIEINKPDKS